MGVLPVKIIKMRDFSVTIEMSNGRTHSYIVTAVTDEHAIDLAYYRDGFHKVQSDMDKYSISSC